MALLSSIYARSSVADSLPPLPASLASVPLPGVRVPLTGAVAAPGGPLSVSVRGGSFNLRFVNVGQLVDFLYGEALRVPHVIASEVLQDQRVVSFQWDGKSGELRDFVKLFLDSLGFQVVSRDGVDFIGVKPEELKVQRATFVYHPRYRSAAYLQKAVQPLVSGRLSADGGAALPLAGGSLPSPLQVAGSLSGGGAAPMGAVGVSLQPKPASLFDGASGISQGESSVGAADDLVFYGTGSEVAELKKVLPELDTAPGEVVVRGWVYEVSNTNESNNAFSIAANLFSGKVNISNGNTANDGTALTFDAHYLSLAISALSADSRFKEVSDPHVRVMSGEKVSLNVGSQ
ncbi:type II secretory pathway protein, partial [Paraburkholderia bryophila]|uniref:type II secretory pathway protein n=1 Tax=Paraburkholderia bryophila TaxID=420952 RepID=UPI0038BC00A8